MVCVDDQGVFLSVQDTSLTKLRFLQITSSNFMSGL